MCKNFGLYTPVGLTNRSIVSIKTEKQSAQRKTPLTSAARISARCHPYVYLAEADRLDNWWYDPRSICAYKLQKNAWGDTDLDSIERNN